MVVYNHYYPDGNNQINTPDSAIRLMLEGPTVPVAVSLAQAHIDFLQQKGLPIPPPVPGLGLIDTGATFCSIDETVIQRLGIPPYGSADIIGVAGPSQRLTYPASLSFPGTPLSSVTFVDFHGADLSKAGIIAIIGRNVLKGFVLVYNGPGGHVSLSY